MSHTSPATYLVWGIISCVLFAFLAFHMWSFDHFKCLRWNNGPYSGTFKRIMTYSYLLSIPLIMTYSLGFAVIKYRNGFMANPFDGTIVPTPYTFWPESERRAIFPLMLTFTLAWSFEMMTHLEELCFWFFVVNSSVPQDWFRSGYFRLWIFGSCVALIYMPFLTIWSRADPYRCEAWTFLGGSLGGLTLTLSFTPILWAFPEFLAGLKAGGVDTGTIVRLTKFHELNMIRVVFRFIFVVPLFILGVDGVRPHQHINESMLWTDFLAMISAFGCCISSALTLVIFFPRSVEDEIATKDAARERRLRPRSYTKRMSSSIASPQQEWDKGSSQLGAIMPNGEYPLSPATEPAIEQQYSFLPSQDGHSVSIASPQVAHKEWHYDRARDRDDMNRDRMPVVRPDQQQRLYLKRRPSGVNPLVHNFTSPLDVYCGEGEPEVMTLRPR
ncbi:hypothetical protein MVEN_01862200 [Mycena venus]|uniref:Uncharacterized protein n=1 Tax=Mycena venus TaxID=2733690 RepID=A0A8H7CN05_9AGAR|nr:hypothetical protein MVEN_01862200 [Mycena venus]